MINHNTFRAALLAGLLGISLIMAVTSHAKELNGAEITQATMSCTECIDWRFSGICFWLKCTWFSCDIETSIRVSHWIPDLVVTSYSGGDSPFSEMQSLNSDNPSVISHQTTDHGDTNADFKKVDVIGNPAILVFDSMADSSDYFCESCATPYMPYFISDFDRQIGRASCRERVYDSLWYISVTYIATLY